LGYYTAGFITGVLKSEGNHPASSVYVEGACDSWKKVEAKADDAGQLVIPRNSDGLSWRWNPCDVRDIVEATVLAMESETAIGEVFNIEGPHPVNWEDGVKYLAKKTGQSYIEVDIPNRWHFETSIEKAQNLLGYHPQHDVSSILDNALLDR